MSIKIQQSNCVCLQLSSLSQVLMFVYSSSFCFGSSPFLKCWWAASVSSHPLFCRGQLENCSFNEYLPLTVILDRVYVSLSPCLWLLVYCVLYITQHLHPHREENEIVLREEGMSHQGALLTLGCVFKACSCMYSLPVQWVGLWTLSLKTTSSVC